MADSIVSIPQISPEGVIYYKFPDATFAQLCETAKLGLIKADATELAAELVAAAWRENRYNDVVIVCSNKIQYIEVLFAVQVKLGEVGMLGLLDEETKELTAGNWHKCICVVDGLPGVTALKKAANLLIILEMHNPRVLTKPGSQPGLSLHISRTVFAIGRQDESGMIPVLVSI